MKTIIAASLVIAALMPNMASANSTPVMETMTITYRSPIDYALYQYTIELLSHFRAEIHTSIHQQAKSSTLAMSKAFNASNTGNIVEIAIMPTTRSLSPE